MFQSKKELAIRVAKAGALVVAMSSPMVFAATGTEVEDGIAAMVLKITGYIALAVAAAFSLLLLSLGPDVGLALVKKWVKKGAK